MAAPEPGAEGERRRANEKRGCVLTGVGLLVAAGAFGLVVYGGLLTTYGLGQMHATGAVMAWGMLVRPLLALLGLSLLIVAASRGVPWRVLRIVAGMIGAADFAVVVWGTDWMRAIST